MELSDVVRGHYGGVDFEAAVLAELAAAGVDIDHLGVDDLAPVDQLHAGFLPATRELLVELELGPQTRLLDVGCGIGGPARVAAATYRCPVLGIDLSPDFIRAAAALTRRVGLAGLVDFRVASGADLGVADGSVDRAMMIHVGMNIPDKSAVFAEVRRALAPGGRFIVFEQMRRAAGELTYPLPWAEDAHSSFVGSAQDYVDDLERVGFVVDRIDDRTAVLSRPAGPAPALTPAAVFGPLFAERLQNNLADTRAGRLAPVLILAHPA